MAVNKNILAFDTALNGIAVGFISREGQKVSRQIDTQREQAALLVPTIQDVLKEGKLRLSGSGFGREHRGAGVIYGLADWSLHGARYGYEFGKTGGWYSYA